MKPVRIGVIGYGNVGSMHAENLYTGKIKNSILAAVCDIDEGKRERAAKRFDGVPVFATHTELLAAGVVDAVIVSVPHYFHHVIAIDAFENGLHVLTEKPAGVRMEDISAMVRAAEKSGKVFGIMFNQRTNPLFRRARELVRSGELGAPKRLTWIITNWYRTQSYYDSGAWRGTWSTEGGGVLTNQAPHNLDILQWIFGMPKRVRGFCYEGHYHAITVEDLAVIHCEYENGATMQFISTTGEYPGTNRLEIVGDGGKIVIEGGVLKLWKLSAKERDFCFTAKEGWPDIPVEYSEYIPEEKETAHAGILENFAEAILTGAPLLAPGVEGVHQARLTQGAYLSTWTDGWVDMGFDEKTYSQYLENQSKKEEAKKNGAPTDHANGDARSRWSVKW